MGWFDGGKVDPQEYANAVAEGVIRGGGTPTRKQAADARKAARDHNASNGKK